MIKDKDILEVVRKFLEGKSVGEISKKLNIPALTVSRILNDEERMNKLFKEDSKSVIEEIQKKLNENNEVCINADLDVVSVSKGKR